MPLPSLLVDYSTALGSQGGGTVPPVQSDSNIGGQFTATGDPNVYRLTVPETIPAYRDGLIFAFRSGGRTNTGACTFGVNGLPLRPLLMDDGTSAAQELPPGTIPRVGVVLARYFSGLNDGNGAWLVDSTVTTKQLRDRVVSTAPTIEDFGGGVDKTPTQNYVAFTLARASRVSYLCFPGRRYRFAHELIWDWAVDVMGAGRGAPWRLGSVAAGASYAPLTTLAFEGSGGPFKNVKTRERHRGSEADPEDDPLSACFNVQYSGVRFHDSFTLELAEGATDWDIGVLVGSRVDVTVGCGIRGEFALTTCLGDATRGSGIPELIGWDGRQYPTTREYGLDGLKVPNPAFTGGRWGLIIASAQPAAGLATYGWDYTTNRPILFAGVPVAGTALTIGEIPLTWSAEPTTDRELPLPATTTAAVAGVIDALSLILAQEGASTAYPQAWSAGYLASGTTLMCVRRDVDETVFDTTFTCSTNAPGLIDVGTGVAIVGGADPAPYWTGVSLVRDLRSGYGASDVEIGPGVIQGGSLADTAGRRRVQIRADHNHRLEGISAGAVWLKGGLAGSSSRRPQGVRLTGTRLQSSEPFVLRLGRYRAPQLTGVVMDRYGLMYYLDVDGVPLSSRYASVKDAYYGPITNTEETRELLWVGAKNAYYKEYFDPSLNNSVMIGSTVGLDTARNIWLRQGATVGSDKVGNESTTVRICGGRTTGYASLAFGDAVDPFRAMIRYGSASGRLTFYRAQTELCYWTLTSDGWVVTSARPAGVSMRATGTGTGANFELRSGPSAKIVGRQGSTLAFAASAAMFEIATALSVGGRTVVNAAGHIEKRVYLRSALPPPTSSNPGDARITNPESGKSSGVFNDGSAWRYENDNSLVTVTA